MICPPFVQHTNLESINPPSSSFIKGGSENRGRMTQNSQAIPSLRPLTPSIEPSDTHGRRLFFFAFTLRQIQGERDIHKRGKAYLFMVSRSKDEHLIR